MPLTRIGPWWRKIKPWVGLLVFVILAGLFFKIQREQHLSTLLPKGWALVALWGLLPWITLAKTAAWYQITQALGIAIGWKATLHACLMSIAGRYIPGKVMFVLGRIEAYGPQPLRLSLASFGMVVEFCIENMAGCVLLLGAALLGFCPAGTGLMFGACSGAILALSCCSNLLKPLIRHLPVKFQPQHPVDLRFSRLIFGPVALTLVHWFFYLAGLYLIMGTSLNLQPLQMLGIGAALWFSSTVGALSILTPGGLGVRESLATFLFSALGLNVDDAFRLAMVSRLIQWAGELFVALPTMLITFLKPCSSGADGH